MSLKVSPQERNEDLCKTSIDILVEKCTDWFHQKNIPGPLWFADSPQTFPHLSEEPVNIVLFGGFLKRFLESGNWSYNNARIWVLSISVKEVLTQILGIAPQHIGVIPRYELFSQSPTPHPLPAWGQPTTLVFGGRLSCVKNIKMLLETVSAMQASNPAIELLLIGDYDNQNHYDQGRFESSNYQLEVEQLIQKLTWVTPPTIKSKMASDQWHQEAIHNPVYVNFSTFMCEDFDVSTAQAQALGWPCLLSDWGGHHEVQGSNVIKIPVSCIAHDHEPVNVRKLKARSLAKLLETSWHPSKLSSDSQFHIEVPIAFSQIELDQTRRSFILKYKEDVALIYQEGLDAFADTHSGRRLFSFYRSLFAGTSVQGPSTCILVNDLHHSENPNLTDGYMVCEKVIEELDGKVTLISLRETFATDTLKKISACEHFILPFFSLNLVPLVTHILNHLSPDKMVIISKTTLWNEDSIRSSIPLRPDDLVLLYSDSDALNEVQFANA